MNAKSVLGFLPDDYSIPTSGQHDIEEEIKLIDNRKNFLIKSANFLLNEIKNNPKIAASNSVSLCLGEIDEESEVMRKMFYLDQKFYKDLEHRKLLWNLKFNEKLRCELSPDMEWYESSPAMDWYVNFDTNPKKLAEYLSDYIKSAGVPEEIITIYCEPDYGFYQKGNRDKFYAINSGHKKTYNFILSLLNKGALSAKKLAEIIKIRSSKVNDIKSRINEQFRPRCGLVEDFIILSADGNYSINPIYKIKKYPTP